VEVCGADASICDEVCVDQYAAYATGCTEELQRGQTGIPCDATAECLEEAELYN